MMMMDPCPFVRLIVESLALKPPTVSKSNGPGVHPTTTTTPCFCTLQLRDQPSLTQTTRLPLVTPSTTTTSSSSSSSSFVDAAAARLVFNLDPPALQKLSGKPACLDLSVYAGRTGSTCGFSEGRLLGRVRVRLDLDAARGRAMVMQSGWVSLGDFRSAAQLHLVVRSEPDPRFVFQFGGEPECSPVVYQVQANGGGHRGPLRQPVFSCRFSADRRRSTRSRSQPYNSCDHSTINGCFGWFGGEGNHHPRREQRKGWTVTIHDLSGSPVAAASMITPFVPSPGSDRVSRSNPGAWLILQPAGLSGSTPNWKPWGRLEAWRERGPIDTLDYRFELVTDCGAVPIAESSFSVRKGGRFCIGPNAVGDAVSRSWPFVGGFVMRSTVEGEGKVSKPTVQVGAQHVSCMADVALFVALSAAVDLSMDACQLFSRKLRKELCQDDR